MIVTKGLGGNLLITQGYGLTSAAVLRYYPYCPAVSVYGLSAVLISDVAVPYSIAVATVTDAPSVINHSLSVYQPITSPYTVEVTPYAAITSPYSKGTVLYTENESPYAPLPRNCN